MNWIEILNKLKPAEYNYNKLGQEKTGLNDKKSFGFTTQDLEKIFPIEEYNIVTEDEHGYKQVNYYQLIPILCRIIQEQQKKLDEIIYIIKTNNLVLPAKTSLLLES